MMRSVTIKMDSVQLKGKKTFKSAKTSKNNKFKTPESNNCRTNTIKQTANW